MSSLEKLALGWTGRLAIIVLIVSIAVLCSAQFEGGNGNEQAPWRISTPEHLNNIRYYTGPEFVNKYFIQTRDIDLGVPPWNEGDGWQPINYFTGNYDGFNNTISNLTINRATYPGGLFGSTSGATIKRLQLTRVNNRVSQYGSCGGLVGVADNSIISYVSVKGNITGYRTAGGIAGEINANTRLSNTYFIGNVTGLNTLANIGGLVGRNNNSSITNCYAITLLEGEGRYVGGLSGSNYSGEINNCYAVSASSFLRYNSIRTIGGLAGFTSAETVNNSFWNSEIIGIHDSAGGGIGLDTETMLSGDTYREAGWAFPLNWDIFEGETYPFLIWQQEPDIYNKSGAYNLRTEGDITSQTITLNWDVTGTPDRFRIYRDDEIVGVVDYPAREWINIGAAIARNYRYYVVAVYEREGIERETIRSNTQISGLFPFAGGTGTEADPYLVASVDHLLMIKDLLSKYFVQSDNIDLSGYTGRWEPIGTGSQGSIFTGSYDGNGFVISNLTVTGPSSYRGFFGYVENAVLRNIGLENVRVSGYSSVGALAASIGNSIVENCYVSGGLVSTTTSHIGGLAGSISGTVNNCWTDVEVRTRGGHTGGFTGTFSGTINNSFAVGSVNDTGTTNSLYIGGFIGLNRGEINNCYYSGIVTAHSASKTHVGGLCGRSEGIINNSYAVGKVTGGSYTGGLTGSFTGTETNDSYAAVNVSGIEYVGGFAGRNESLITNSYSIGEVKGENLFGGFIGSNVGTVVESYWNINTSGQEESAGGRGLTLEEMLQIGAYSGWDFNDIWSIRNGLTYPYLEWQGIPNSYNIPAPYNLTADENDPDPEVLLSWDVQIVPIRYNIYRNNLYLDSVNHNVQQFMDNDIHRMFNYTYYVTAIYVIDDTEVETVSSNIVEVFLRAAFTAGSGTEEDPYHINSPATLSLVREHLSAHFIQTEDIALGVYPWNYGEGWMPIGTSEDLFLGSYNGNGHIITGLTLRRTGSSRNYQALFGQTGDGVIIKNLGMKDVYIDGNQYLAGIVARAGTNNTISNCFVTGFITGWGYIGGICAEAQSGTRLTDSYSTASLISRTTGTPFVGGIVANSINTFIERCYAIGMIEIAQESNSVGSVIGRQIDGTVSSLYWNKDTTNHNRAIGNVIGFPGNNTLEFVRQVTFQGFDFDDVWRIDEERSYPYLQWEGETAGTHNKAALPPTALQCKVENCVVLLSWSPPLVDTGALTGYNIYRNGNKINDEIVTELEYEDPDVVPWAFYYFSLTALYDNVESVPCEEIKVTVYNFAGGRGTSEDPWIVSTAEQLNGVRFTSNAFFRQESDIDLYGYNEDIGWIAIGDYNNKFTGVYDGGMFTISNLYLNRARSFQGLFGYTSGAVLSNIVLRNVNIRGVYYVGGLVGNTSGTTISDCSVEGVVSGIGNVGGIAGSIAAGTSIRSSFAVGKVTAELGVQSIVGGLTGSAHNSTIADCFSSTSVSGNRIYIGGLVGGVFSTDIIRCYHTGIVKAIQESPEYIGGLVGSHNRGEIIDSYWDIETSTQQESAGGGLGRTTGQMTYPYAEDTFVDWDFDDTWTADVDYSTANGYPYLKSLAFVSVDDEQNPEPLILTLTNYPNPFNPDTTIEFNLPQDGQVELDIYNIKGQKIRSLHNSFTATGKHCIIWNGKDDTGRVMPSGIYLYRLTTERESITRKMMMVK